MCYCNNAQGGDGDNMNDDAFIDFATEDFINKNIRLRPISGVTNKDDRGERQSNNSRCTQSDRSDTHDNYNAAIDRTIKAIHDLGGVARAAEDGGGNWLTIHARTRAQGYKPPVDWAAIARARRDEEDLFMLMVFSETLGIPNPATWYTLELQPLLLDRFHDWHKRMGMPHSPLDHFRCC